jgi:hypothetical protein
VAKASHEHAATAIRTKNSEKLGTLLKCLTQNNRLCPFSLARNITFILIFNKNEDALFEVYKDIT